MKKLTTALILITTPAIAESPCDYTKKVQTSWTHHIEKTSNIKKNVFQYVENTRKCMMTMDVTINGVVPKLPATNEQGEVDGDGYIVIDQFKPKD